MDGGQPLTMAPPLPLGAASPSANGAVMADIDPRYVAARHVLLDALFALAPHGKAVIVAGAQAVYLRTGDANIAVAPYTTDGDLALDPQLLGEEPEIEGGMTKANFYLQRPDGQGPAGAWLANGTVNGRP